MPVDADEDAASASDYEEVNQLIASQADDVAPPPSATKPENALNTAGGLVGQAFKVAGLVWHDGSEREGIDMDAAQTMVTQMLLFEAYHYDQVCGL